MPYSFKILIHEVKLIVEEAVIISDPIIGISFANYPRLLIKGSSSISTRKEINQAFKHGKSTFLQIDQIRLESILREQPLEVVLQNNTKLLAGARIKLDHFVETINDELKFKRGNFTLIDSVGRPFALADISIAIHAVQEIESEPVPEEIIYKQKIKDSKQDITVSEPDIQKPQIMPVKQVNKKQPLFRKPKESPYRQQIVKKTKSPPKRQPSQQRAVSAQAKTIKQKQRVRYQEVIPTPDNGRPTTAQNISILEWAQGNHCPPPMLLDKKVYVHTIFNSADIPPPMYVKVHSTNSVSVQTDYQHVVQDLTKSVHSKQSETSYQEDFESIGQSQSQQNLGRSPHNAFGQLQHSRSFVSPKQGVQKTAQSIQEVDDDVISDIYSDDFEQSYKKSVSKKEEISDSYIPDFESISQSMRKR